MGEVERVMMGKEGRWDEGARREMIRRRCARREGDGMRK